MKERRKYARRQVQVRGLLSFGDGHQVCRLLNLSAGGALITLRDPQCLPDQVSLYYDNPDGKLGVDVAWCHVVRRGKNEAALSFFHTDTFSNDQMAA